MNKPANSSDKKGAKKPRPSKPNQRTKKPLRSKKLSGKGKIDLKRVALISLAVVTLGIIASAVWSYLAANRRFESKEPSTVIIPENATADAVSDSLSNRLGDFGETVYTLWHLRGGKPERAAGVYTIIPGDIAWTAATRLLYGRSSTVKVTFNNVRLMSDLAARIAKNFPWNADDFLKACDEVLGSAGYSAEEYPAAFIPDTYDIYESARPAEVVGRLLEYRDKFWNEERMAKAAKLNLTPAQVCTVASIVEEESNNRDEQPHIARLYLNRLAKGMKLQADPTVKFALGDFSIRRLYEKHTHTESPYNTYAVNGLPPGPIRIVEASTIDAVLDAPQNDYIYMCAKPGSQGGKGSHNFSADYETHLNNARAYQAWLDSINIK